MALWGARCDGAVPGFGTTAAHSARIYVTRPARDQVGLAVKAGESLSRSVGMKVTFRTRAAVQELFAGTALIGPGVVPVQDWRPASDLDFDSLPTGVRDGVGRKGYQHGRDRRRRTRPPRMDAATSR